MKISENLNIRINENLVYKRIYVNFINIKTNEIWINIRRNEILINIRINKDNECENK